MPLILFLYSNFTGITILPPRMVARLSCSIPASANCLVRLSICSRIEASCRIICLRILRKVLLAESFTSPYSSIFPEMASSMGLWGKMFSPIPDKPGYREPRCFRYDRHLRLTSSTRAMLSKDSGFRMACSMRECRRSSLQSLMVWRGNGSSWVMMSTQSLTPRPRC